MGGLPVGTRKPGKRISKESRNAGRNLFWKPGVTDAKANGRPFQTGDFESGKQERRKEMGGGIEPAWSLADLTGCNVHVAGRKAARRPAKKEEQD